jgi:hypothetical protein
MSTGNLLDGVEAFGWFVDVHGVMIVYLDGRAGWSRVRPDLAPEA